MCILRKQGLHPGKKKEPSHWKPTHFTISQDNTSKNVSLTPRINRWGSTYWDIKWHLHVCWRLSLMINWVGVPAFYVLPEIFHFFYFLLARKIGPYYGIKHLPSACFPRLLYCNRSALMGQLSCDDNMSDFNLPSVNWGTFLTHRIIKVEVMDVVNDYMSEALSGMLNVWIHFQLMTKMVLGSQWELDTGVRALHSDEIGVVWKLKKSYWQKLKCHSSRQEGCWWSTYKSEELRSCEALFIYRNRTNTEAMASLRGRDLFTEMAMETQLYENERLITEKILQEIR